MWVKVWKTREPMPITTIIIPQCPVGPIMNQLFFLSFFLSLSLSLFLVSIHLWCHMNQPTPTWLLITDHTESHTTPQPYSSRRRHKHQIPFFWNSIFLNLHLHFNKIQNILDKNLKWIPVFGCHRHVSVYMCVGVGVVVLSLSKMGPISPVNSRVKWWKPPLSFHSSSFPHSWSFIIYIIHYYI